jgi:predicted DNA-binding transcriptional regulator YafY
MQSSTPVQRQWQILIALMSRRQGLTIKELADEVGVNTRTILRDLNTLRGAGFPLEERVSDYGRKHWKVVEGGAKVPIHFTWSEAVALYLGRRLLDPLAGTHFWQSAHTAFAKIRAMLGESALNQLEKVSKAFLQTMPSQSDYGDKAELIDRLLMATEDHKITWVQYRSERATEPVSLEVYPYGIVYHKGALYLVAFSRDHDGLRHFKIDRVSEVDVQNLQFTPDPDFSLEKHLAHSFGIFTGDGPPQKVRVRFTAPVVRILHEKRFHPSQQLAVQSDGSVIAEYQLASFEEFTSWVLSFGPQAEVLEPETLRQTILADLEAARNKYRHPNTDGESPVTRPRRLRK